MEDFVELRARVVSASVVKVTDLVGEGLSVSLGLNESEMVSNESDRHT